MKSAAPRATVDKVDAPATSKGVAMVDNRAVTVAQRQAQAAIDNSPRQVAQRQQAEVAAPPKNTTGLPDNLKAGVERLSGHSLDDVQVHYNSAKPAQLQAHAYAQGTDIHVAPGQEKHLPHEAWHVVQQKKGSVVPNAQLEDGSLLNDNEGLETEADIMGGKALNFEPKFQLTTKENLIVGNTLTVQRMPTKPDNLKYGASVDDWQSNDEIQRENDERASGVVLQADLSDAQDRVASIEASRATHVFEVLATGISQGQDLITDNDSGDQFGTNFVQDNHDFIQNFRNGAQDDVENIQTRIANNSSASQEEHLSIIGPPTVFGDEETPQYEYDTDEEAPALIPDSEVEFEEHNSDTSNDYAQEEEAQDEDDAGSSISRSSSLSKREED